MPQTMAPWRARGRLVGLRVLIAEDLWVIADNLSVLLEEEGARVVGPAASNRHAIDLLRGESVDFALVDMNLKDAFADELTQKLIQRSIPYAIVTAYEALPTNADEGAVKVLKKPIDRNELVALLRDSRRPRPPQLG